MDEMPFEMFGVRYMIFISLFKFEISNVIELTRNKNS